MIFSTKDSFRAAAGGVMAAVSALLLVTGCDTLAAHGHAMGQAKPYSPPNHAGDAVLPFGFRRVVVLPVAEGTVADGEAASALDPVVIEALQRQNRFEVVPMTRSECRMHFLSGSISSVGALPANLFSIIKHDYNADGVLFVDLTVYNAYQPLAMGFRAKLAKIEDSRIVWTFDNVFSAANPEVAASATRFLRSAGEADLPPQMNSAVLDSPVRFASYVSATMFATLPPVNIPKAPVLRAPRAQPAVANPR